MKLALVQFDPELKNKSKNESKILKYANDIDADIIIFPELATSGYFFTSKEEIAPYAEEFQGEFCSKIQAISSEQNKIICYGFPEKENDLIFNSAAIIFPEKDLSVVYRKTHLFYRERFCFTEGNKGFFVIEDKKRDLKIGTMICYDWRFPEAARTLGLKGADIILCPSNLVTDVWHISMPSRALENKVYLACANRIGTEENIGEKLLFTGYSAIYGFNGQEISKASQADEEVIYAEIDPEKTRNKSFNEYNDIFGDRRPDMYQ